MSALRRAMMAAKKGYDYTSYIQDGLVFQLDCDKECSAEKWTDLIGGVEYNGSINITDTGVPYFDGTSKMISNPINLDEYTIETFIEHNEDDITTNYVFSLLVNNSSFSIKKSYSNRKNVYRWYDINNAVTVLCYSDNMVHKAHSYTSGGLVIMDGNEYSYYTTDGGSLGSKASVGGRSDLSSNTFIGKIYAIRIYNRLLSAEEMIANQTIDSARFSSR